jgi:hypothetical protein
MVIFLKVRERLYYEADKLKDFKGQKSNLSAGREA